MKGLTDFLIGVFTRHPGAKILALLLSAGLFGFVHASLTGTQEIPRLELTFTLADELRLKSVLLTPRIPFLNVTITGTRAKVDPLARQLRDDPVVKFTIDRRFLDEYADPQDKTRIPITAQLLRDDPRFGADIKVDLPPGGVVLVDALVQRTARLEISRNTPRVLPPDHPYEGTLKDGALAITLNVKGDVTLSGPESAFPGEGTLALPVSVPIKELARAQIQGESGSHPLTGLTVEWQEARINLTKSDTKVTLLEHLRVSSDLGQDFLPDSFQRRLEALVQIRTRRVEHKMTLPVQIRYAQPPQYDLKEWTLFKPPAPEVATGSVKAWSLQLPVTLSRDQDFLKNLVLVLNVGAADNEGEKTLLVPVYLDLIDRERGRDLQNLDLVGFSPDQPVTWEFRKG
jgi:hypothetical protein